MPSYSFKSAVSLLTKGGFLCYHLISKKLSVSLSPYR